MESLIHHPQEDKRFYIHTMGCKSNQFESSVITENLQNNGLIKVNNITDADIYILIHALLHIKVTMKHYIFYALQSIKTLKF